jgi:ligand-binding sensor domain-containing protein
VDWLWLATEGGGVHCFNLRDEDTELTIYSTAQGLSNDVVRDIHKDRKGNFWASTEDGLNLIQPETGKITVYTTKDGLSNNFLKAIYEDAEGSLWIGSRSGLNRLKDGNFPIFPLKTACLTVLYTGFSKMTWATFGLPPIEGFFV